MKQRLHTLRGGHIFLQRPTGSSRCFPTPVCFQHLYSDLRAAITSTSNLLLTLEPKCQCMSSFPWKSLWHHIYAKCVVLATSPNSVNKNLDSDVIFHPSQSKAIKSSDLGQKHTHWQTQALMISQHITSMPGWEVDLGQTHWKMHPLFLSHNRATWWQFRSAHI